MNVLIVDRLTTIIETESGIYKAEWYQNSDEYVRLRIRRERYVKGWFGRSKQVWETKVDSDRELMRRTEFYNKDPKEVMSIVSKRLKEYLKDQSAIRKKEKEWDEFIASGGYEVPVVEDRPYNTGGLVPREFVLRDLPLYDPPWMVRH